MGGLGFGQGYFGQYSLGGTVPPDTPATADITVEVRAAVDTVQVHADVGVIQVLPDAGSVET